MGPKGQTAEEGKEDADWWSDEVDLVERHHVGHGVRLLLLVGVGHVSLLIAAGGMSVNVQGVN